MLYTYLNKIHIVKCLLYSVLIFTHKQYGEFLTHFFCFKVYLTMLTKYEIYIHIINSIRPTSYRKYY